MKKYNHKETDFFKALGSDKEELMELVNKHIAKNFDQVSKTSISIVKDVKKTCKDLDEDELLVSMFLHGMMFQQAINTKKMKDIKDILPDFAGSGRVSPLDLLKSITGLGSLEKMLVDGIRDKSDKIEKSSKKMPFSTEDLMKSVKSEMENKNRKS